ncbi:MAG: aspartate kinase [Cyanobacteria bacterium HKST-UBA04]|nr:aspartate kinase [Cyanobacteria bacterium HKST-UBA04]
MSLVVLKFGGTSVGNAEKIRHVARVIADVAEQGNRVAAIVSAMGKTTDGLVELAGELVENPSGREYDALLATGEMVSAPLLAMTLTSMGYPAVSLNGQQAGFVTEDLHNRARILEINTGRVQHHLDKGEIVIVTGFQGINSKGDIATLGRGGSDTSAIALAGALGADRCDIYTDVDGVYSADPRVVPEAVRQDDITYIEMLELARVGAKVLHPRAVETARNANVRIRVRSTFDPDNPGTLVSTYGTGGGSEGGQGGEGQSRAVSGIAADKKQVELAMTHVPDQPGIAAQLFGALASNNISVDMIIQSVRQDDNTNDIAFTVDQTDLQDTLTLLEKVKADMGSGEIYYETDVAKVSIVGVGMIDRPGIAADMFKALAQANINLKMISTSEIKISCLIDQAQADDAVRALHRQFFPEAANDEPKLVDAKVGY